MADSLCSQKYGHRCSNQGCKAGLCQTGRRLQHKEEGEVSFNWSIASTRCVPTCFESFTERDTDGSSGDSDNQQKAARRKIIESGWLRTLYGDRV
jgi:hypothetical protein